MSQSSLLAQSMLSPLQTALWFKGVLSWILWPQQIRIYQVIRNLPRSVTVAVLLCARQYGKSFLVCTMALEDCLQNPGVTVLIIAPTIKHARKIVRPRIKKILQTAPKGLVREIKYEDTWYIANGSKLILGGFETGAASQRGETIYKIYIEETRESKPDNYDEFVREDLAPALTHSKHAQIIHATTLTKIPDHPFVLETIPEAQLAGSFFKFTIEDNEQLSPEQYASIVKMCGGKNSVAYRVEYMCEQVRDGSIILAPEFDEAIHVHEFDIPSHCYWWVGGDTGGTRDFSCFLLFFYDFKNARYCVWDERAFGPETGTEVMVAACREMEKDKRIGSRWVDAAGQLQVDLIGQHKYSVNLPRKDELEATINQVRIHLQRGEVWIHPRCKFLITTLRSGHYNDQRSDLARTKTLGHMDGFMALAYGLRHPNKANPYPKFGDARPDTHFIPEKMLSDKKMVSLKKTKL